MPILQNAILINTETGQEIPLYTRVPDKEGHSCLVEALIDHPEGGPMVLISHEASGAHNVFPHALNARIERRSATTTGAPSPGEAVLAAQGGPEEESAGFLVFPALDLVPGTLLVAVGPGAAGKSTYADTTAAVDVVVCLDSLRREIGGAAGDQSTTPAAVERQNALLEQHLSAGATVFLDSTNVEPHVRAQLIDRARRHDRPVVALCFLTDLDTCLARNALRPVSQRVPDDTLRWQHDLAHEATTDALLREGFTTVHLVYPRPAEAPVSDAALAPERLADAVAVLRKAQEGDEKARRDLADFFPEYEGLVMQTDHARYLALAANAGLVATHLLIIENGEWFVSVDTYTSDFGMPLASVALGDSYASRTEAIREAVRAATDHGWALAPEQEWSDFDCGGGEIHIPIHALPTCHLETVRDTTPINLQGSEELPEHPDDLDLGPGVLEENC
jgi:predicted kinase